jgi:hypothetical protein
MGSQYFFDVRHGYDETPYYVQFNICQFLKIKKKSIALCFTGDFPIICTTQKHRAQCFIHIRKKHCRLIVFEKKLF